MSETGVRERRLTAYQRQDARLERYIEQLQALDDRFFWFRLTALLAGLLVSFAAFRWLPFPWGWIVTLASIAVFTVVVYLHNRLDHSLLRFKISRQLIQDQIARMQLDWPHIPWSGVAEAAAENPFAADLNLAGERSLLHLIDTSMSRHGGQRLRDWLLNPALEPEGIRERQEILREMLPRAAFRRRLALNGGMVSSESKQRWDGEKLIEWLDRQSDRVSSPLWLVVLSGLAILNILLVLLQTTASIPPLWILSFTAYAGFYLAKYRELQDLFGQAYELSKTLNWFRVLLVYLESYPYDNAPRLKELCRVYWRGEQKPSRILNAINRTATAASLQNNFLLGLFLNAILPWDMYVGYVLDRQKRRIRNLLPDWLEHWYTLEALNSLANFAHLNPEFIFPTILERDERQDQPLFDADQIGHPLIPAKERVCNDFTVDDTGQTFIVTGSNMSGKSTFLRTLGINLFLAYAGGAVCARRLETIPFRVFTCINVSDSLSYGISYFYAEVRRLKALLMALERENPYPVFYLIDEIFRGTNNLERQIGSRAYVRELAGGRGVGVISTHDLELVHLEETLPKVTNFHFREDILDGRMVFDYQLRPGPCPTTNALRIMRLEGLPVDGDV